MFCQIFLFSMNDIISKLKEHQPSTPSKWRENAEWRMANKSWLRYSQQIDMMSFGSCSFCVKVLK